MNVVDAAEDRRKTLVAVTDTDHLEPPGSTPPRTPTTALPVTSGLMYCRRMDEALGAARAMLFAASSVHWNVNAAPAPPTDPDASKVTSSHGPTSCWPLSATTGWGAGTGGATTTQPVADTIPLGTVSTTPGSSDSEYDWSASERPQGTDASNGDSGVRRPLLVVTPSVIVTVVGDVHTQLAPVPRLVLANTPAHGDDGEPDGANVPVPGASNTTAMVTPDGAYVADSSCSGGRRGDRDTLPDANTTLLGVDRSTPGARVSTALDGGV